MVAWVGDGLVTAYDAPTGKLTLGEGLLVAPDNTVDANLVTRLQYNAFDSQYDQIKVRATFVFNGTESNTGFITPTPSDINWRKTASLKVVPASAFAAGVIPTTTQLEAAASGVRYMSATYVAKASAATATYDISGPRAADLTPGAKYWLLVQPYWLLYRAGAWNPAFSIDRAYVSGVGYTVTKGRAVSFWTNRGPTKPVITAPVTGSLFAPGDDLTLSWSRPDPDGQPGGAGAEYTDIVGGQVQYAPKPTPDNPTPAWLDLPTTGLAGPETAWKINGSDALGQAQYVDLGHIDITVGASIASGYWRGVLPSGDWQLRVRTFDQGNGGVLTSPGVYRKPITGAANSYTPDTYPVSNISPWSDAIIISIPAQVPPPVPISPTNQVAIAEGLPIPLTWKYKNTATPPFPQAARTVQVRRVGDTTWNTIASGSGTGYTIPAYVPGSPGTLLRGWDWESSGLGVDGWAAVGGGSATRSTADFHSGVASLLYVGSTAVESDEVSGVVAGIDHEARLWVRPGTGESGDITIDWYDASHTIVFPGFYPPSAAYLDTGAWQEIVIHGIAPATAIYARIRISPHAATTIYVDDATFKAGAEDAIGYPLLATHLYEWRVKVTDSDAVESQYSQPAQFWIVEQPASGAERPAPDATIDGATLGCGKHIVEVFRRGGKQRVGEIKGITYVDWARVRDDISTAKVVIEDWDIDCGNLLAMLQCWAYELVIFRDNGYSIERVWEGPLTLLTYEESKVTLEAKDVMGYAYRRIIKQAMSDAADGDTVVSRAVRILQNTLAPDDPNVLGYLTVLGHDDDAREYRSTPAYTRTAFEEIDDMAANAGLDYTTIGRAIVVWGTKHRIGTLPEFRDEDLGAPPIVSEYGMSMANRYVVADGNGVWGEATRLDVSGNDATYGLVEMLSSSWASDSPEDSGTYTQAGLATIIASFEDAAERSISDRYMPGSPVIVRIPDNTTLNPGVSITIQQLVPGVVIPLRSVGTLRTVVGNQKLDSVKVVEQSGNEVISITLSPFNRDDITAEEGAPA